MHFSSAYTRVAVSVRQRHGGPETRVATITLTLALEVNLAEANVNQAQLSTLMQEALNRHAGGARTIGGHAYQIEWRLVWSDRGAAQRGAALGVSLLPTAMLDPLQADGMHVVHRYGGEPISRMLIGSDFARLALSRNPAQARAGIRGFGNAAAHEVGHAQGVTHRDGTLMDHHNTTRIDRHLDDAQVAEILRRHIPEL